jgi:hypothetical protein
MGAIILGETITNPIAPFQWRADYVNGGRLCQYDVDGHHKPAEIDLARLARLVLTGPHGELALSAPAMPDSVFVIARKSVPLNGRPPRFSILMGFIFGDKRVGIHVSAGGRITPIDEPV